MNWKKSFKKWTLPKEWKKFFDKRTIKILISICLFVVIMVTNINAKAQEVPHNLTNVTYVYEDEKLIGSVEKIKNQMKIQKKIDETPNSNINYKKTQTLLTYDEPKEAIVQELDQYVENNTEEMVEGYVLKIDNKKYYVDSRETIEYVKKQIFSTIITDQNAYNKFIETGTFQKFEQYGKIITGIEFENEIEITEEFVPKKKVISDKDQLLFSLLHENTELKYYTVGKDDTLSSIQSKNNMSEMEFYFNNPKYQGTPLLNVGDQILISKLNPVINIAVYSEATKEETIKHPTVYKDSKDIAYGEKKVKQKGKDGKEKVTYKSKSINKIEIFTQDIKHEIIKPAVEEIILKGTKKSSTNGVINSYSSEAGSGEFIWPMNSHSTSCGYGCYPGHEGLDITGPYGGSVYSATSGTVIYSQYSPYGGGYEARIYYNGKIIVYAHMKQQPNVSVGQTVGQGQQIGYMGTTGNVTGAHLHFEIREGGSPGNPFSGYSVDSRPYLP